MNGELAQAIALAAHGSVWLRDPNEGPPDLSTSSTFDYVQSITFVLDEREVANRVTEWFEALRDRRIQRLWLEIPDETQGRRWLADHLASAFAGGGRWLLVATANTFAEAWRPVWTVDRDTEDRGIWRVVYIGQRVAQRFSVSSTISDAESILRTVLTAARGFAVSNLPDFVEAFDHALASIDGLEPGPSYYADMLPQSFPLRAQSLIAACAHAWVFGGMGSWNDAGFADEALNREHSDLSRRLWQALTAAVVAAVNVDLDPQPPGTTTPAS